MSLKIRGAKRETSLFCGIQSVNPPNLVVFTYNSRIIVSYGQPGWQVGPEVTGKRCYLINYVEDFINSKKLERKLKSIIAMKIR
jgi:hypothetical protein